MEGPAPRWSGRRVRGREGRSGEPAGGREDAACQDWRADPGQRFFRARARQSRSVAERKAMIDGSHTLPLARQAEELGISRSSLYYQPQPVSAADLALMRRIDELHLEFPFAGSRMLRDLLKAEGFTVGRLH